MPEPTPDLAAIVREIDLDMPYETASLLKHWPTIRAALERRAELERALERIEALAEAGMPTATQWMHDASDLIRIREVARKALLARSAAAEEGSKRG